MKNIHKIQYLQNIRTNQSHLNPFHPLVQNTMSDKQKGRIVQKYYQINKKLGQGAFGQIYLATNTLDNSQVALKIQSVLSKRSQLVNESRFIIDLLKSKKIDDEVNIPNVYSICKEGNCYIMIMDLLGNSLQDLFNLCGRKFSLKTTVLIGWQMLKLIKYVHSRGILHRDIKPDNFLIGKRNNMSKIYMIDFGLAKKYLDKSNHHISYRDNKDLTGTARYASINTHIGIEQGRRDDLQSWIYVLIYFAKGQLPWQSMKGQGKKEKYQKIMEKKLTISISYLTESLPKEFEQILSYIRSLHFDSEPDYEFLYNKLQFMADNNMFDLDDKDFDWIKIVEDRARKSFQERIQKEKELKQLMELKQERERRRSDQKDTLKGKNGQNMELDEKSLNSSDPIIQAELQKMELEP